jgi:hypothetical protein
MVADSPVDATAASSAPTMAVASSAGDVSSATDPKINWIGWDHSGIKFIAVTNKITRQ